MDITPEVEAILRGLPGSSVGQTSPTPQVTGMERIGKNLANLPGNMLGGAAQGVLSLLEMGTPGPSDKISVPSFFDIPAPTSTSDIVGDFLVGKGGVADVIGQTMLPAGILGKAGKAVGIAEGAGLEALKYGAGFMVPEANREEATGTDIGVAALSGATQGPLGLAPMKYRAPISALLAGLHGLYETSQRGAMTGGITAAADFVTGLIPAAHGAGAVEQAIPPAAAVERPAFVGPAGSVNPYSMPRTPEQHQALELLRMRANAASEPPRTSVPEGLFAPLQNREQQAALQWLDQRKNAAPLPAEPPRSPAPEGLFDTRATKDQQAALDWLQMKQSGREVPTTQPLLLMDRKPNPIDPVPVDPAPAPKTWDDAVARARGINDELATVQKQLDDARAAGAGAKDPAVISLREKYASLNKQANEAMAEADRLRSLELEPPPKVETTPRQQMKWTIEEQKYSQNHLVPRYQKLSDADLKETIADLDNEIANTLDEASIRSYSIARETASNVLDSRRAPEVIAVESAKAAAPKVRRGMRVSYKDEMGGMEGATVVGFDNTEGTVRLKFDEGGKEVVVPASRVDTAFAKKEKLAPLQKWDEDDLNSARIREEQEASGESTVNMSREELAAREERVPGRVRENQPVEGDLHEGRWSKGSATGTGPDAEPSLVAEAKAAMEKIVAAVKAAVNKNLQIKAGSLPDGGLGFTDFLGNITYNFDIFAERLRNWHTMDRAAKSRELANFARVVGHESGHTALAWVRAQHPAQYEVLLEEFSHLTTQARERILGKFHKEIGFADARHTQYTAGNPGVMAEEYKIHPDNIASLQDTGMQEFFSEMFSAHIFNRLKEENLPPEMLSVWQKVKAFLSNIITNFKPSDWWGPRRTEEEIAAFNNFKEMVEEIQVRFHAVEGKEYVTSMRRNQKVQRADEARYSRLNDEAEALELMNKKTAQDAADALEYERLQVVDEIDEDQWLDGLVEGRYLRWGGLATDQLVQEFGSAAAGAIIGGVAGPTMTNGQVSMAEGILMGGVLGALGPRAIRALVSVPKSPTHTFHHKSFTEALKDIFRGNAEAVAADAATGHGSSVAQFVRFLERNMNLHLPPELFNAVVDADGAAAWALHTADDAFKKARSYKPSAAFTKATEDFLANRIGIPVYKKLVAGLGREAFASGQFYVVGREAIATLQKHFMAGLPDGKFKSMIAKSLSDGDYLTRQYRIFHDPKYRPTPAQIEAVAQKYVSDKKGVITLEAARQIVEDYVHQIKVAGADFRGAVTDVGKKFDSYLWENRQKLDAVFRDMLGEYHDPREKVLGTIQHLYTSSITGHLVDSITKLKDPQGLAYSYGFEEHSRQIEHLQAILKSGSPPPGTSIASVQKQLDTLRAYVPLESNIRYGKLGGKMVSRFVRDQLATFDSPWGLMDGTIMRNMAKFHNYVKIARAPLNPITVVRNIIAMPVLTVLGGVNPLNLYGTLRKAYKLIKANGPEVREMLEQGVLNVDAIRGEMLRNVDYVRMLDVDDSITGLVKKGVNKALDFYRWPDMLVRGATYLTAKQRFARELKLPEGHVDVIAKARDWTNRYTVNYANVAPIVKTLRQVPFTNLFISYTAEITRIAKNLVQDSFKHPDPGQRVRAASLLGGLAALPFGLEKFATMQLSEKDRKEWEKARDLMPAYQRTKHLIVTGRESDGRFRYFDMTPLVQIDAITQLSRALAAGDMEAAAAVNPVVSWENTPAVNIISEQITGEDLRTGRSIDKNILTRARAVLDDIVPPVLPGGYEFRRWSEALTPTESGDLGVTNARTGRRTTPGEIVGSYLTGMRIGTVDANKLHQFAVADAKRAIANEAAYMRDVIQTNVSQAAKEKAVRRFRQAQENILLELTAKLQ